MSIILFTGAGASASLGYPTARTFFGSPPTNPGWDNDTWNLFLDLFVGEKGALGADGVVDVERVLQFLDDSITSFDGHAGAFVKKHAGAPWLQPFRRLKTLVLKRYFSLYGKQVSSDDVARLYEPLLSLLDWSKSPVSLFTTNCDPVCDKLIESATEKGLPAYDGFDGRLCWAPEGYDDLDRGLTIYRLHGALSWIREGSRVINTRIYDEVPRSLIEYLFIHPGSRRSPADEGEEIFALLHQMLKRKLVQAEVLLVIGYSFRDPSLNEAFESSMRENNGLKLFLVLPQIPRGPGFGIESLMSTFPQRVKHFPVHFGAPKDPVEEKALSLLHEAISRIAA